MRALALLVSVACVVMAAFLAVGYANSECKRPNASSNAKTGGEKPPSSPASAPLPSIDDSLKRIAEAQEALVAATKPSDEKEREQKDLEAQQEMACWAQWMFYATAFAALVAAVGAGLLLATLRQARTSAEIQLRAYIMVRLIRAEWEIDPTWHQHHVWISVKLTNEGQTPAKNVRSWVGYTSASRAPEQFGEPKKASSPSVYGPRHIAWITQRPNGGRLELGNDLVEKWRNGTETCYVWGRVDYVDAFGTDRSTTFRYMMFGELLGEKSGVFTPCNDGNDYT